METSIETPHAPALDSASSEGEQPADAYGTAINALLAVLLSVLGSGVTLTGLAIWKFAPVMMAILEFLAKLTARTDDDAAVARLRADLTQRGLLPGNVPVGYTPSGSPLYPPGPYDGAVG